MTERLWLVRLGKFDEQETHALETGDLVTRWEVADLSDATNRDTIREIVEAAHPERKSGTLKNWAVQLNQLRNDVRQGDLTITPLKTTREIAIGRVSGPYKHVDDKYPTLQVKWLKQDVPRDAFKQDLLYSLGVSQTICEISRNNAVERVNSLVATGKDPGGGTSIAMPSTSKDEQAGSVGPLIDPGVAARDQIKRKIASTFTGHAFTQLVAAILEAQGYIAHVSPPGPDAGDDIVAGRGTLGFDAPRLVVQVRSGSIVVDHSTLQSLNGCVHDAGADHGLIVSWSGFRSTVRKEANKQYFRIRFWDRDDLVDALLGVYDDLSEDIRAGLPLKRIWTLVPEDSEDAG